MRGYIVVAAVFLVVGIVIGANLQSGPTEYVPPEPEPTDDGVGDTTLAVIAGLAGAAVVMIVGGTLLLRKETYKSRGYQ